ncbi:MAG TPA: hypothetical protein VGL35_03380 [Rhizomicrobium sp.]|jgi:hypothetical protein
MRGICGAILTVALFGSAPSFAQLESGPNGHSQPILQGESTTPEAPRGGIDQAGVATPPAVPAADASNPLQPGPPAGYNRAATLSNADLIAGGVAVTAIIVCAIACFSSSSSTTTSTTAVHH